MYMLYKKKFIYDFDTKTYIYIYIYIYIDAYTHGNARHDGNK